MNKSDNIIKWTIIGIFVGLYAMVSAISTIHVIDFFRLSNPNWLAITLAIAFEIGAAASLGAIVILDKTSRFMVWMLFLIITAMQMMGNMYYAYTHLTEYQSWSELFGLIEEEPIYQKRILSLISGAILPLVALGFIKSLVDYIRPSKDKTLIDKEIPKDTVVLTKPEEESNVYDTPEVKEKMLADLFDQKLEQEEIRPSIEEDIQVSPSIEPEENPHNITIESVENKEEWPPKEEIQFYKEPTNESPTVSREPQTINTIEELRHYNKMHA
jgi:hypothetical protein